MASRLFAALILTAVLAVPVAGQEPDTAAVEDTSRVPVATLAPLVVTVSKVPLPAHRTGFAFSLIGPEQLSLERPMYVTDALRTLPGTYIDEAVGPGGPTIVRLRGGEEVFTQILVDGVQLNRQGGFFDMQGFTLSNLERIEVARGPQSALYGSSAVSGVVQFITRRGEVGPPRFQATLEGGEATVKGGSFRASGEISGGSNVLRYSGGLGGAFSRGIYALPNDIWTLEGNVRLDLTPAESWSLQGIFRHVGVESDLPVRDPGATRVPLDPNARIEQDRTLGAVSGTFRATDAWSHTVKASWVTEPFVFEDKRDDVADAGNFDFSIFDADFRLDSDFRRGTVEYHSSYEFLPGRTAGALTLAYGAQWQREDLEDRTSGEFGEGVQKLERNSVAGFVEVVTEFIPRLNLLVGTRIEKYEGLSVELTPRASARVTPIPNVLSLRGAVGRAYKAPNLQEQFLDNPFIASNPDLESETSTSWELGADVTDAGGAFAVGLTYFRQSYDGLIRTVAEENSTKQINRNLGESRAQGLEWLVEYRPSDRWLLGSEGAWIETEILDNTGLPADNFPVGEQLPFRPSVVGSVFVEVSPLSRLTALLRGRFVGEQAVLTERFAGERVELDPYFLASLRATFDLSDRSRLYARIDNLFDVNYETAFDRQGSPLTAALGVQVSAGGALR